MAEKKHYQNFTLDVEGRFLFVAVDRPIKDEYKVTFAVPKDAPGVKEKIKELLETEWSVVQANYPNAPKSYENKEGKTARSWHSRVKDGDRLLADKKRRAAKKGKQVSPAAELYAGCYIIEAKSKKSGFGLCKFDGKEIIDNVDPKEFYSGIYGCLEINLTAHDNDSEQMVDNPYLIAGYIGMILKTRDGKRLGGRTGSSTFAGALSQLVESKAGVAESLDDVEIDTDDDMPF